MRIQTEIAQQQDRDEERNAPAPGAEVSALMEDWVNRITSSDMNRPMVAVVWIQLV